MKAALQG